MLRTASLLVIGFGSLGLALGITPRTFGESNPDFLALSTSAVVWFVGIYAVAQAAWQALPDPLKRLSAAALRKLPTLPNAWKRRVVKNELEGSLNAALREFNREGAGFIEHEIKIEWLTPNSDLRETFFRSGKAFLKLSFSENNDRNMVEAALKFSTEGLLQITRQYIPNDLMKAIDLVFVDEVLDRRHAHLSRAYLTQEVVPREIERSPQIESHIETLSLVSQQGLFTRVFLPELRDYPGHVPARMAQHRHQYDIREFLVFLDNAVKSRETRTKTALVHVGAIIRVAIVLVGIPNKLRIEGTRPYVRRAAMHNELGARTVYLLGYNEGAYFAHEIAKEAKARGLVSSFEIDEYNAIVGDDVSNHILARMTMVPESGSKFLQEHEDLDEWPDLDDDGFALELEE